MVSKVYADYEFYRTEFGGSSLTEETFPRFAVKATAYLDHITCGRSIKAQSENDLTALALACCAIAEVEEMSENALKEASAGNAVQSETVGNWSRSYRTSQYGDLQIIREYELELAMQYLGSTKLMRAQAVKRKCFPIL